MPPKKYPKNSLNIESDFLEFNSIIQSTTENTVEKTTDNTTEQLSDKNSLPLRTIHFNIDLSLNSWFKEIEDESPEYIQQRLNEYLRLGHFVNQMTHTQINEDILKKPIQEQFNLIHQQIENKNEKLLSKFEGRMSENLDRVKTSIEKFTEFSHKSSFKGAMGENIIESIVQNYFPDDTITNTSKKTAEADYHLQCNNGTMILIESKFYSSVINKHEIDKFRRDLIKTGFPIGIFVSISSGIVGRKRFDIEKIGNNQWILYLPNAGLEGSSVIWSILFAKEFYKTNQMIMSEREIYYDWNDWEEMYDAFQQIFHAFSTIKLNIFETRNQINKQLDDLIHKSYDIHFQIQNITQQMKLKIENQLNKKEKLKFIMDGANGADGADGADGG